VEAMELHQRPHLIYNVDKTGLKLTYNFGHQKLLAVKDSKKITLLLKEKNEKP
jgi:hypothetical protein